MMLKNLALVSLVIGLLSGCEKDQESPAIQDEFPFTPPSNQILDPFQQNARLGRGINLGNALEAPNEGDWGVTLKAEYFKVIKEAGFQSVRLPVKWSGHASPFEPYTIDPTFFTRVDWAIGQAISNGLAVVLNIMHYDELMQTPDRHRARFLHLWADIAAHYRNYPDELFFELLNEPNANLTAAIWNDYLKEAITTIRKTNPYRTLIVGPASWNSFTMLSSLVLPETERNLIITFHYYNPFQFTHQGAEWVSGSNAWLGTTWSNTLAETEAVRNDFNQAETWAQAHNRPLYVGEFGAYSKADLNSRFFWTAFVAREAERRQWSWTYWEFCAGFGAYDATHNQWNATLKKALIP